MLSYAIHRYLTHVQKLTVYHTRPKLKKIIKNNEKETRAEN